MPDWINKILNKFKEAKIEEPTVYYGELPQYTIEELEKDLFKRSWAFEEYQKKHLKENPRLLHWIGSISYSGYQRENSLVYLINHFKPGDENRILLRLEDWVKEVQDIAKAWVLKSFDHLSLEEINAQHHLIIYLSRKRKLKDDEVLLKIYRILLEKASKVSEDSFNKININLRRLLYKTFDLKLAPLRERILKDPDPFNRLIFLQKITPDQMIEGEKVLLKNDKSPLIKRRFIEYQAKHKMGFIEEDFTDLVLDTNKAVRDCAKYYLKKHFNKEAYDLYKKQEDQKYYYIADYGKAEDKDEILKGFKVGNISIKKLCIKALCSIDPKIIKEIGIDEILQTGRAVEKLVQPHFTKIYSIQEIKAMKEQIIGKSKRGELIYLNILYLKSFWDFIEEALQNLSENYSREKFKFINYCVEKKTQITPLDDEEAKQSILKRIEAIDFEGEYNSELFIEKLKFILK